MRKILKQAKLIVAVESYKGKSIVENNPNLTIQTLAKQYLQEKQRIEALTIDDIML